MGELYSHSRLDSFETCPQKFQYRYLLKVPAESEGIEGFVGKRVHEVLERLYLAVGKGQVPSLRQVIHRYRKLWEEAFDPGRIRIVRAEHTPSFYRSNGEKALANYYRAHYPFDGDETLALEKRFVFDLDGAGSYRIQGIVDRLSRARDGAIEIVDYKTARRLPRQKTIDQDRQLALYQIGVANAYGPEEPVRLVWHYVLHGRRLESTRTPAQLQQLREGTIRLIDRIRAETRFEPKQSALCDWCEYNHICPARVQHFRLSPPAPALPRPAKAPVLQLPAVAAGASPPPRARARADERAPRRRRRSPAIPAEQLSLFS